MKRSNQRFFFYIQIHFLWVFFSPPFCLRFTTGTHGKNRSLYICSSSCTRFFRNDFLFFLSFLLIGEVDMWTKTSSGCACSSTTNATTPTGSTPKNNKNNKACACCNQGACQCGQKTPYRCAQCGLEQHCDQSK